MGDESKIEETHEELDRVLAEALVTNDKAALRQDFHKISNLNNTLRRIYGIPLVRSETEVMMLKSPQDQMKEFGVAHTSMLGHVIVQKMESPIPVTPKNKTKVAESLFHRSFNSDIYAKSFEARTMDVCARKFGTTKHVVLLPPLLMRSNQNASLRFRCVGRMLARTDNPLRSQVLIVMFEEGPIVPVLRKSVLPQVTPKLYEWYSKQGHTDSLHFLENFV